MIKLSKTDLKLTDYNKKPIKIVGVAKINVVYGNQNQKFPLVVVRGNRSPIFGRNWPREIKLHWSEMMKSEKQVNSVVVGTTIVENLCDLPIGSRAPASIRNSAEEVIRSRSEIVQREMFLYTT